MSAFDAGPDGADSRPDGADSRPDGGQRPGPNSAPISELAAPYDPGPTRQRIARLKGLVRSRLISLGIAVVLLVVVGVWQHRNFGNPLIVIAYAAAIGLSVAAVVVTYLLYRRSRRPLSTLGQGVALRISRGGVELAGQGASWGEVAELAVRRAGWGFSPDLELTRRSGPAVRLPLDQIGSLPATMDSVARAYSGGRHGVDLSALDN